MDLKKYETLSPEEQTRVFHEAPLKERGELLDHSHDPQRIVRSLSHEELYLTTREMDLDERAEILRYATLPQLFFVSDIDCWKKDRIDPDKFLVWLETLLQAGDEKLLSWMLGLDAETLVAGMRKLAEVIKPEREYATDELLGDTPYFTLDENYFILVREENLETVRRVFEILFENQKGRYAALLESLMSELEDELEEEAYRLREGRLGERGFPDVEIAHRIYRPISDEEFRDFPLKKNVKERVWNEQPGPPRPAAPNYMTLWAGDRLFFDELLTQLQSDPEEVREGLQEELAWLSNKVIACEGIDFSSEERVRHGAERARAYVSIGLEALSGREPEAGLKLLRERWLEVLFRYGMTRAFRVRDEAAEIVRRWWHSKREDFLLFLNPPYEPIFRGLLKSIPEYYDGSSKATEELRDYRSLEEIEKGGLAARQVRLFHEAFERAAPKFFREVLNEKRMEDFEPTLYWALGTLYGTFILDGKPGLRAFSKKDLLQLLQAGFSPKAGRRVIDPAKRGEFIRKILKPDEAEALRPLLGLAFESLEEELGGLEISDAIDARFISALQISQDSGPGPKPKTSARKRKR